MTLIDTNKIPTHSFDWGLIKWLVSPHHTVGAGITFGEVVLLPGEAHARHNHPGSEEVLYILSGTGAQMIDDGEPFAIGPGDTVYIPKALYHSTTNTGWATLRFLAIYNPGGPDRDLVGLPDFKEVEPGKTMRLLRPSGQ